ncbi:hypothetical protein BDW62DRAFT_200705 [Aspergillus aurantiobrunneus]
MPTYTRTSLTTATKSLCTAFSTSAPLPTLLSTFTSTPPPRIHEHGLPSLAPFLGRTFSDRDGLTEYFNLLAESLTVEDMGFDEEGSWAVDTETGVVCLRGRARFASKRTGEKWVETFIYRITLAEEQEVDGREGGVKVRVYEIWADTGAAYLAGRGELKDLP